ncbi:hypothetical protein HFO63_32825 [Rhizobium laguerreae]|uniref:hypothetical protein n=1 Tax=Rhizobium laguerreae TaxID=1076926 RepID=UPI001C90ECF3|nr:hypothetical protein [Rhizobium laguerreae]MBY3150290.1 hypothetical protein [Rhizobium laguerreae]MBY3424763.1 hypothetical protein [Rhizobium laguerreae]
MSARIRYSEVKGNTVPYPPLFDEIRRNYGFVDTRGQPDRIAEIPEARESMGLTAVLRALAKPGAPLVSLGCDLGQHLEPKSRIKTRHVAGGYVQVVSAQAMEPVQEFEFLRAVGTAIESGFKDGAASDVWVVDLQLAPVVLKFDIEIECRSIWIWFYAKASTPDRAIAARERLLLSLERVIDTHRDTTSMAVAD